jgi:hypothetical protein
MSYVLEKSKNDDINKEGECGRWEKGGEGKERATMVKMG